MPELAVVVVCWNCETSVDWVTRVKFWESCEFLSAGKSCCDLRCAVDRLIDDDFHCSDDSSFHKTCSDGSDNHRPSLFRISKGALGRARFHKRLKNDHPHNTHISLEFPLTEMFACHLVRGEHSRWMFWIYLFKIYVGLHTFTYLTSLNFLSNNF